MKFNNKSSGGYFVYWRRNDKNFTYICRFCEEVVNERDGNTILTIITEKGRPAMVRCCAKEECREMALFIGQWQIPYWNRR